MVVREPGRGIWHPFVFKMYRNYIKPNMMRVSEWVMRVSEWVMRVSG